MPSPSDHYDQGHVTSVALATCQERGAQNRGQILHDLNSTMLLQRNICNSKSCAGQYAYRCTSMLKVMRTASNWSHVVCETAMSQLP